MSTQYLSLAKTLNPPLPLHKSLKNSQFYPPKPLKSPKPKSPFQIYPLIIKSQLYFSRKCSDIRCFAGRSKAKPGGTSGGRIEGNADIRREAKKNARKRSKKLAESLFYRLKNPNKNYPDNFSEEELQMIGLGYDRMVRFMEKDDPNLKHPYDWYKYGEFGPYSWRGVVLGEPIRGRFSDECVTLFGEVRDQEEWEKIEQHEMSQEFRERVDGMGKDVGFRYFWVFVRHPKWRVSELPWEQWTLVCEVAVEAGDQRLDKWTLMGRLGNKSRASITQCAAWMRPDIIYVKRPVYQCRFEPQDEFFRAMAPLLDPETEQDFLVELESADGGSVEFCTYFGGLCRICKVSQKAFVDDVVNAYDKLSNEEKSRCLGFLLNNHPTLLLHPYTKEWKAKLEEMELGCDAPEDDDYFRKTENEVVDWIEDDEDEDDSTRGDELLDGDGDEDDAIVVDARGVEDEELGIKDIEADKYYSKQIKDMEEQEKRSVSQDGDELFRRGGPRRKKVTKSRIPPGIFLRSAVRPFTYRNLVKEIVLTRHCGKVKRCVNNYFANSKWKGQQ
ncbi:hypothetical protein Leryth_002261 [Lithospermum erythrorhizon]|nr:hypothetical protein Leryth_002261 [Lithospermum erythrorhizon]